MKTKITQLFLVSHFFYISMVVSSEPTSARLPLMGVIAEVLKNQWDILISAENIDRQAGVVQSAAGPFDPRLDVNITVQQMNHVQMEGFKTDRYGYINGVDILLSKKTRVGTEFAVGARATKTYNPILLVSNLIPSERLSTFNYFFTVNQPLMRGYLDNPDYIREQIAKVELEAVIYDYIQTISLQIRDAVRTYWDLVAEQKLIQIREQSQRQLTDLLEYTKRLIQGGELAYSEIFQQYAEIAREETQELAIQVDLNSTFQQLLFSMGIQLPPQNKIPDTLYLDEFPGVLEIQYLFPLRNLLDVAWNNRADFQSAKLRAEATFILLKEANNRILPHLNLKGRAEYINSEVDPRVNNFMSAASSDNPELDLTVILEFSYPLGNNEAMGNLRSVSAENKQAILIQDKLHENIRRALTASFQNHRTLVKELKAAARSVKWFKENLRDEISRLKEGFSTIFIVIDFQRRLNEARTRQVEAWKDYAQNFVDLLYNTGTLVNYDACQRVAFIANLNGLNAISSILPETLKCPDFVFGCSIAEVDVGNKFEIKSNEEKEKENNKSKAQDSQ